MTKALAAATLLLIPVAAQASDRRPVVAVAAERASGFETLAECKRALGPPRKVDGKLLYGSATNRAHGNQSRCEVVGGEPMIVIYPRAT